MTTDPTDDALAALGLRKEDLDPAAVEAVRRHVEHHDDRPAEVAGWLADELNTHTEGCVCVATKDLMASVLEGHDLGSCPVHQPQTRPVTRPNSFAKDLTDRLHKEEGQTP